MSERNVIPFQAETYSHLVLYDAMVKAVAEAHRTDEVKEIRDKAVALEEYARQAKNEELERQCREIRERAERRWGELYTPAPAGRPKKNGSPVATDYSVSPKLEDMGVTKRQSVQWQARAAIPEEEFEATLAAGKSTDSLVKKQRRQEREEELGSRLQALPDEKYGVIVEDFEWDFQVHSRETGMDRHAANHYPVSERAHTADEIFNLTAERFECAANDCVLFMWATVPTLNGCRASCKYCYKTHTNWWLMDQRDYIIDPDDTDIIVLCGFCEYTSRAEFFFGARAVKRIHALWEAYENRDSH